ncbi:flagellar export chaperone FliS [Desulfofundulus sp. TPOSR]|uniref:flagellar export chaperone FliS n=1 Tax=Desulfofundulus sp. TPOSR TaxID=2714340 RepID=UPI00140A5838|nr:flagellar export chaperone FliS [Desulfofundulus sp. TPOSR]NHM28175.1 flagellar export chaperone FliS [Desulfofundulus sp. TPOSR]
MQAASNPYQQYLQNAVLTAEPGRLTLMLYTGAVRFIRQASDCLAARDIPGAHRANLRAQDIIIYLLETVNREMEIGKNLSALYDYMYRRLVEANVKKDAAVLDEVAGLLEELAGTWEQALKLKGQQVAGG